MFLSLFRAAGADDRSPWGDFWFQPVPGRAGRVAGADSAMQLAAVYACVRVLSESLAVLPARLYRPRYGGRGREVVRRHWLVDLLRRPNAWQTNFEWREMLQAHLVLRGNAFCQIVDDGAGGIAQLVPLHPDRMRIETVDDGAYRYRYMQPDGTTRIYRRDQVWHLRGLSGDGLVGMSPIELQQQTIASGLSAQEYGNRFFFNDAKPTGGWIEFPGKFADREARQTFRDTWAAQQGGANRGKVAVLEAGMKFHEVGMTNKDSQFLEARGFNRSEIAGIFRVPPHMIADLARATFSNIEQQSIDFWQGTMLPWTERWEASLESLLGPDDAELELEFDFRNLMRGDTSTRGGYLHNMVLDGILTRNEARAIEGYDPIEGLDEPLMPLNESTLSDADPSGEAGPGEELPDAVPGGPSDDGDDGGQARLAQLLRGNAQRMARRFAKAGLSTADAPVLAEALAVPMLRAFEFIERYATAGLAEDALADAMLDMASRDIEARAAGTVQAQDSATGALLMVASAIGRLQAPDVNVTVQAPPVPSVRVDNHVQAPPPSKVEITNAVSVPEPRVDVHQAPAPVVNVTATAEPARVIVQHPVVAVQTVERNELTQEIERTVTRYSNEEYGRPTS